MAELLLLPLVRSVAGKAADALVETVTRMCGLDNDRRTLERQLLVIECKLANAEERSETNNYVKSWMKELKSVAYEANDVLDDFQYEALRRQSKIGMSNSRKVLGYFMHHRPLLFRFEMSKKLKSVLEKINKLVEEMNKFGLENYVRRDKEEHPWRQTHSKQDETTQIFGREDDKEVVVKLLLDQHDQRRVQVLPIIGMGGLGKTTLAKMVYNNQWVQQHFQLKMWHCVSDNFDASALLKSIIELATSRRCDMPDAIELLQKQLEEVIGKKRFMLVLDDVWNEDERRWEDVLKPLLCSVRGPGSVIVVTTRSQKVASIMQTLEPHKLACLSEQDSWELFAQKAYSNGVDQEQAELVSIGRRIVNKCRGLPLALKTMGGLLSSKQNVQEWKAIEGSNIGENDGGKYEVMPILKLSYKHLSSEMKQCFAFCAVFPKDYQMEKVTLIQLWMANGFIQEEGTIDLKQKGELIFNELVWRSFLQDKKVEFKYFYGTTEYEIILCTMHDLMHDLAKVVTDECASIEELTQKKALFKDVCHMQISKAELEQISGLCKGKTNLRTFLAPAESRKDFKEYLLVSASLRALRCSPSSVTNCKATNAKHLRYLDLSWSNITKLPESICVLYNLQTLRLIGCDRLRWLPKNMVRLRKLIHLHLSSCGRLESMSPNFGLLKNLHILTTFVVGTGDGLGIEQLKDLQNLSNRLELLNLNKIKSGENAKEANLSQKQNLSELLFSWHQEIDDEPRDVEEVLECLEPPCNIQKLEIRGYGGLEMSQWMRKPRMFDCLRELKISNCPRCKSIPIVWFSTSLEILSLQKMDNLITLCNSLDMEAGERVTPQQIFPKLKKMRLIELPSLEIWAEDSAQEPQLFNCLEELEMTDCPRCKSIPPVWFSVSLEILSLRNMDNLTTLCNNLDVEVGEHFTPLQIFPRLKKMRLIDLPSLEMCAENSVGEPSDCLVVFPMLEKLRIKNCPKLASIPVIPMINKLRIVEVHSGAVSLVFMCIRSGFWPFLTKLTLGSSPEDIPMLSIDAQQSQSQRPLEKLTYLYLEGFNSLVRSSELSRSQLMVWKCFSFVEELRIYSCFNLVRWPSEELRCLVRLRFLDITNCESLEGSTSSSEEETLPLSLEEVLISHCGSMVALPSNIGKLAKMRSLVVSYCSRLKVLPDGMCGLTSLRQLTIRACAVEEFPHGLLERLPALEYLCIDSCRELERRCIEGGEYFHLLSSVPSKWIRQ